MNPVPGDNDALPVLDYAPAIRTNRKSPLFCIFLTWLPGVVSSYIVLQFFQSDATGDSKFILFFWTSIVAGAIGAIGELAGILYLWKGTGIRKYSVIGMVLCLPSMFMAWYFFLET